MKILFLFLSSFFLTMEICKDCTLEKANKISDKCLVKSGYKLSLLNKQTMTHNEFYVFNYTLKDSSSRGGGALIKVSRADCRILEKKFYQ